MSVRTSPDCKSVELLRYLLKLLLQATIAHVTHSYCNVVLPSARRRGCILMFVFGMISVFLIVYKSTRRGLVAGVPEIMA